jgi:hypothetical protein
LVRKIGYSEDRKLAVKSILDFLDGTGGPWDWDDFISIPSGFADLDDLREFCARLPETHPPTTKGWYCSETGLRLLRSRLNDLVRDSPATPL